MKVRVASAGTGKTTSLVLRYLELIASGIPLRRIAGVTFTRKAADELKQRVAEAVTAVLERGHYLDFRLEPDSRAAFEEARRELDGATLTTIHGFMGEALRLVAPLMGIDPDFSVLGAWEAQALFEEELRSVFYLANKPEHDLYGPLMLLGADAEEALVALFKQRSLSEAFQTDADPRNQALLRLFERIYKSYEIRLGAKLLAPSEVERRALKLVRTEAALKRLSSRYAVLLVDEFQDVNPLQGRFFEALERGGIATEVVGDPKQSIYGFRNADVEVFRRALQRGEGLPPLAKSYRHASVVARFLNGMTRTLARDSLGFRSEEAEPIVCQRPEMTGRVELHWVTGDESVAKLREREAQLLAERLKAEHETRGTPYRDMAVLARSYGGLTQIEAALGRLDLPYVLLQGRGYFERTEIRDVYHALKVGVDASGLSLAAWLRSPFAQLELSDLDSVLQAENPVARLEGSHAEVFARLEQIQQQVRGTPVEALKFLIRTPFIGGKRYVDFLSPRERENVDALLFTVAQQPPGELEFLLERLEQLSRQPDAGEVPQSGDGVQLLTVHRAKGLEWPVVAVFDLGRGQPPDRDLLKVSPDEGEVSLKGSESFEALRKDARHRSEQETYRLLYVAASRARDVLMMTGSVKQGRATGWAVALERMNLGTEARPYRRPDFILQHHAYRAVPSGSQPALTRAGLEPAPWIDRRFVRHDHPPVTSPSRYKEQQAHEPLLLPDPEEGELLPGRGATIGTLVHDAISKNWRPDNSAHLQNLRAQEVMFPYADDEKDAMLQEVRDLLENYYALLGRELPALEARCQDHAELPMALRHGATVWQGVIDRLYQVEDRWILEDYKTDQIIRPETYHFQLAVYLRAIRETKKLTPQVQLVYLRDKRVIQVAPDVLERAFDA